MFGDWVGLDREGVDGLSKVVVLGVAGGEERSIGGGIVFRESFSSGSEAVLRGDGVGRFRATSRASWISSGSVLWSWSTRSLDGVGSGVGEAVAGGLMSSVAGSGCASGISALDRSEAFSDSSDSLSGLSGHVRELWPVLRQMEHLRDMIMSLDF